MSFASSSSSVSALRSGTAGARCFSLPATTASAQSRSKISRGTRSAETRHYSNTAAAAATAQPVQEPITPYEPSHSSTRPQYPTPPSYSPSTPLTASAAQSYLSSLLSLPPSRQFSPSLSLQILTHKSYRYAHPVRHPSPSSSSPFPSEAEQQQEGIASHNSRLSFLGRRALATYFALFIHEAFGAQGQSSQLRDLGGDFLRGKGLQERIDGLRHVNNVGRVVGKPWGIGEMIRWDRNENSRDGGSLRVSGMAVESVLGAIFTQFGSPAAHRAFHLHVLPHYAHQLRDPRLVDRAESVREDLEREFGRGILPPS